MTEHGNRNDINVRVRLMEENMDWIKTKVYNLDKQVDQLTREVIRATTYIKIGALVAPFFATFLFWLLDKLTKGG